MADDQNQNFPDARLSQSGAQPVAFIMHHTAGRGGPAGVVNWWKQQGRGYGAQYIMDRNGVIHDTQKEFGYGGYYEILPGAGQYDNLNNHNTVGMEIVAKNDADVTPAQAQAAARFIQARYPDIPVYGHGTINPGHKEATEGQSAVNAVMALRNQGGDGTATAAAQPAPALATAAPSRAAPAPEQQAGPAYGSIGDHVNFIYNYARQIGLDPNTALGIANAEGLRAWSASNPAAGSHVDVSGGKPFSFGDFQLNVKGGLGAVARQAGVEPSDPSQWQAADRFSMDWMKAHGLGPWRGDPAAKAIMAGGRAPDMSAMVGQYATPMAPGPVDPSKTVGQVSSYFNFAPMAPGPVDPEIIARGKAMAAAAPPGTTLTSTAVPAAAANPLTRLFGTAQAPSDFAQGITGIDKAMGGKSAAPGGQGAQDQGSGPRQMQTPPMPPPPMARNVAPPGSPQPGGMLQSMAPAMSAALTGYQPQTYGTGLTSFADPLQWGGASPGASPYANAGAQGQASPMGTSLISLQQLQMMDPDRFALLYGVGGGTGYGANTGGQGYG